jgi:hypothetical protein
LGKKIQNCGKDFSVKSREKTKLKKTKNPIFPEKKMIFLFFFLIRIFSWKTDKLDPKRAKSGKHMGLRPIYNFCEKTKSTLKILKCVKVNTVILVIFSSYLVIYTSNFLKWCFVPVCLISFAFLLDLLFCFLFTFFTFFLYFA